MNGVLHAQLNDFGNSVVIFERLCNENPNKPECFNNLAVCIIHNSKNKTYATELLEKAIRLNRNYLDAQKNLKYVKNPSIKTNKLLITKRPLREVLTHIDSYEWSEFFHDLIFVSSSKQYPIGVRDEFW